jgi:drug/metabolite transporter (DMT)-like permease
MSDLPASRGPAVPAMREIGARPLAGIAWMALAGLTFVGFTAAVKHAAQDIPVVQASFMRFALGMAFVVPGLLALARMTLTRRDWAGIGGRGLVHGAAVCLWFYAMTRLPLAEVTAMNHLNPVFVTLGAALLLGEGLPARRLWAVAAAMLGAAVILRPGMRAVDPGHLAMLGTALCLAASYLIAKSQTARMGPAAVVAAMSAAVTVVLAPAAWAVWVAPSAVDWAWMALVAGLATAGHYAMTQAFAAAPAGAVQPAVFLQLVWAVLLGWALVEEPPDPWVIAGGAVIVGAVTALTLLEARARRRAP